MKLGGRERLLLRGRCKINPILKNDSGPTACTTRAAMRTANPDPLAEDTRSLGPEMDGKSPVIIATSLSEQHRLWSLKAAPGVEVAQG